MSRGARYGAEQPAANCDWKQMKSLTFSTGGVVLPSQLAFEPPAAKSDWKQTKSLTLRIGGVVLPSQLAVHGAEPVVPRMTKARSWCELLAVSRRLVHVVPSNHRPLALAGPV